MTREEARALYAKAMASAAHYATVSGADVVKPYTMVCAELRKALRTGVVFDIELPSFDSTIMAIRLACMGLSDDEVAVLEQAADILTRLRGQ